MTDIHQFDDHMGNLWVDMMDTAYVGMEVKSDEDQVCVVQLASCCRVVLLDALSLPGYAMHGHIEALLGDVRVVKVAERIGSRNMNTEVGQSQNCVSLR